MRTFLTFLVFTLTVPLFSQTAARLEVLLGTPEISWEQAAGFILEASDTESPGWDFTQPNLAFQFAAASKWLPKNVSPGDSVRLKGIALLLMKSFNLKGGVFYSIFNSPHHAYRELVYKNIIRGNTDPDMRVSGQQLLLIVNRILAIKEQS